MGSTSVGVLYGVRVPEGTVLYNDFAKSESERGLLERYERATRECLDSQWHPTVRLMGAWVIRGPEGEDDAVGVDLPVALDDLTSTEPYAAAIIRARERWDAFASWCAAQGVTLPPARLWLALTEVG